MKLFSVLEHILDKSSEGGLWIRLLNLVLPMVIPFNHGHGYKVLKIGKGLDTKIKIPHRKSNWNHLRGIHACALATGAELSAGLTILTNFSPKTYRIIMADLQCSYAYQARKDCIASVNALTVAQRIELEKEIEKNQKATIEILVTISDSDNQIVCEACVLWQVKPWVAVKSQIGTVH